MKVLDLFCGAGGASDGYHQAGFEVVGVDIKPQPHYPYEFILADALWFLDQLYEWPNLINFDVIHASPPCQGYSKSVTSKDSKWVNTRGRNEPRLIKPLREKFLKLNIPYVIENVTGAHESLISPSLLCGTMFELPIARHRLFETSFAVNQPKHPRCRGVAKIYAEINKIEYRDMSITGKGRHTGTSERWSQILGINRMMRQRDYSEAIPPAYTKYIGEQFRSLNGT